ncbi:hypothetical protein GALMADRAFT_247571 [Galerina marginata CBS 339.88]|uniref:F-box domain-containing protein n=1 Tax=Galerina marginata (strain CBS 339.88) TaxID=685588 RepID=A0A067SZE9_GALM3|nr:hypothetical protein GALMADRAFT_247571 [Galerina marginata CBS 339.88]
MDLPVGLLSVPEDLLVQEILAHLGLSSLASCMCTCRQLHALISSSVLLNYLKELEISGMIDNSRCSRRVISLKTRLEMLRERELRWMNLDWKWRTGVDPPPLNAAGTGSVFDGGLMVAKLMDPRAAVTGLYTMSLPHQMDKLPRWREFDIGQPYLPGIVAVEEDLLACVTFEQCHTRNQRFNMNIHLLRYSTLEPHSSAISPILRVTAFWTDYGRPNVHISICGDSLAFDYRYSIRSDSCLVIWNWKTGVTLGHLWKNQSLPRTGLAFLTKDLLVTVDLAKASIDVIKIPQSSESLAHKGATGLQPFLRLKLPVLQSLSFFEYAAANISGRPRPMASDQSRNTESTRPFLHDPLSTILSIYFRVSIKSIFVPRGAPIEPYLTFYLIIHRRVLLEYILQHPASVSSGQAQDKNAYIPEVPWEDWGIENTRMFAFEGRKDQLSNLSGTKCIITQNNNIEVLEFGRLKVAAHRAKRQNESTETKETEVRPGVKIELVDYDAPSRYPDPEHVFGEDIITCLPYIKGTYGSTGIIGEPKDGLWDGTWDSVFMDESHVIGTKESKSDDGATRIQKLDMLYFG